MTLIEQIEVSPRIEPIDTLHADNIVGEQFDAPGGGTNECLISSDGSMVARIQSAQGWPPRRGRGFQGATACPLVEGPSMTCPLVDGVQGSAESSPVLGVSGEPEGSSDEWSTGDTVERRGLARCQAGVAAGGMQRGRASGPPCQDVWYYHTHLAVQTGPDCPPYSGLTFPVYPSPIRRSTGTLSIGLIARP